ncbi:uncharacterized protein Dyak_GE27431 [Drosophila yakuba]|uniref:Reverse transcriptase domain-containing protein n=1 Tax=Drosophila yakuba TaxID=7245 RepID=A0A0R1E8T3_DROYA|nr:uncharacterized protein Dyak_GE27431 [Drosophila yakuba]
MPSTDSRGRRVLNMAARIGILTANVGATATFNRLGNEGTIPDITLVSENGAHKITDWKVLDTNNGSDHNYITFNIAENAVTTVAPKRKGWNVKRLDKARLILEIDARQNRQSGGDIVNQNMATIKQACNAAMPKMGNPRRQGQEVYWWTDEIKTLRETCIKNRRRLTRARRRGQFTEQESQFKKSKKDLTTAIWKSKTEKWKSLCNDVNTDPWGMGYKIVMKKLRARRTTPDLEEGQMDHIVKALFPDHTYSFSRSTTPIADEQVELFTVDELQRAAKTLKRRKAPGPDNIPAEVLTVIAENRPQILMDMYNECITSGKFPDTWKLQRLVLISKGKGDPLTPSAYRPLCMLNTTGKLEKMIKPRLSAAIERGGGLSPRQHGFRPGRSTIGAIQEVVSQALSSQQGNHFSRPVVLLATLDVKNAFNSVQWGNTIDALKRRFQISGYLMRIIQNYLDNRRVLYQTIAGEKCIDITSGAAQGSILGPELWNISYDEIFHLEMPDDTFLVGYADDIVAVITARNTEYAQRKLTQVMTRVKRWLNSHDLKLADEKTELLLVTRRRIPLEIDMRVGENVIRTRKDIKYLGVRLDSKLTFSSHIQETRKRATVTTKSLSRLMANVGGPLQSRRKLLMEVSNAIMLYGCEVWAGTLETVCR